MTEYSLALEGGRYDITGGSMSFPPYDEILLDRARHLIRDGQPQAAVLIAHMACEVLIAQVIIQLMERKGLPGVAAWADQHKDGFSFGTSAIRALYLSLSGDRINKVFPRWKEYYSHVELRNRVAHRGQAVTMEEAGKVCVVAAELAAHLRAGLEAAK